MPKLYLLLLLTAAVAFSATSPAAKTAAPAITTRAAAAHVPADAELERAIRAKLAASKINTDKFTVHVQGSVATLTGNTNVMQHKGVATRLAKSAGALAVVNKIEISQAAKDKAAANLAGGRRRAQIKKSDAQ